MCVIFLVSLEFFNIVIRASVENSNFVFIITEGITLYLNKSIFFFQSEIVIKFDNHVTPHHGYENLSYDCGWR